LEISSGVFSSSRSIIASDVYLRIFWVSSDGETDERKERKGGDCFKDDNENGFKALKMSIKHSAHPESLNSDLIKLKCSSLEFFHKPMIRGNDKTNFVIEIISSFIILFQLK
jgi:hypothetical protein